MAATETVVRGFGHCPDPRCAGSEQTEVPLVQTVVTRTFIENGGAGSVPGEENTWEYLRFAEGDDVQCQHCRRTRECSTEARPAYNNLSGKDPMGLLAAAPFNPSLKFDPADELRAQMDDMRRELDELRKERGAS